LSDKQSVVTHRYLHRAC